MPLVLNGTTGVQDNSGAFVQGTAVASTSGTSIDFTSIPSWVKRVTVMFNAVSTSGTSNYLIQVGDSGGIENTGYVSFSSVSSTTVGIIGTSNGAGFYISVGNAGATASGSVTLNSFGSNSWTAQGILGISLPSTTQTAGVKTLSATLDRVRITTVNGTDTFDAGSINILYE